MRLSDPRGEVLVIECGGILGRSPRVEFRRNEPVVSGQHAVIGYSSAGWSLRDLGSKNGTWVRRRRLDSGERLILRVGDSIRLGKSATSLTVTDLDPPPLMAIDEQGTVLCGREGVLALPGEERPELVLFCTKSGYMMERAGTRSSIYSGQRIECQGQMYRVELPTVEGADTEQLKEVICLSQAWATFEISEDQKHVRITVACDEKEVVIPSRSFCALLVLLAQRRIDDEMKGISGSESGWIGRQELVEELAVTPEKLNLDLHRARRALAAFGVAETDRLIERRQEAGLLRIGFAGVEMSRPYERELTATQSSRTIERTRYTRSKETHDPES